MDFSTIVIIAFVAAVVYVFYKSYSKKETVAEVVKQGVSEVEQRLWDQSVANVGKDKDEIKAVLTAEAPVAKKTPVKKATVAKKTTSAVKKAPAKKTTARKPKAQ
jgi:hypothetical protein